MSAYPEHEKLEAVAEQSQAIGEFLDLGGYTLCIVHNERYVPVLKSITWVLAEYFGIDTAELEREKRSMVKTLCDPPKPEYSHPMGEKQPNEGGS